MQYTNNPKIDKKLSKGSIYQRYVKRMIDFLFSFIVLLLLLPLLIITAFLVKATSRGPALFTQDRIGKDKKIFIVYKFRTMVKDADKYQTAGVEVIGNDSRITRIGRILRRYKIDELAQLINILKGEMAIVGPRPTLQDNIEQYEDWELRRFDVRPGLTGLAQINGNIYLERREKSAYDIQYINNISFLTDIKIILKTIAIVILGEDKFIHKIYPRKDECNQMKRTLFIGSVISSKVALESLIRNGISIDFVCSLTEEAAQNVSDYYPIHDIAEKYRIPYLKFNKINSDDVIQQIKEINPDFIFVIGLSQIISKQIINLANEYCIGFHPTPLPKYRGRAAISWQIILGVENSKISIFKLDENMDSGDIIFQYPYIITKTDYAQDVYDKVCDALSRALDECLPEIYSGTVDFIKQNQEEATYLLVRRPDDSRIDWNQTSSEIETLIRAASRPYPGAFAIYKDEKVLFLKARVEQNPTYIGIPGQIAWINDNNEIGIITKDALLIITEYEIQNKDMTLIAGKRFH